MSGLERWWQQVRARVQAWTAPRIMPEHLSAGDASTRWRALQGLRNHAQPALLPAVLSLLDDEDVLNRAAAVDVLISWGPNVVLGPVQQALDTQPRPTKAAGLLQILAHLPTPENRTFIEPWLQHEADEVKAAAFQALAALGDDADVPHLTAALRTEAPVVQQSILAGLCAPAGEAALLALDAHNDPILQQLAAQARARIQAAMEPEGQQKRKELR